MVTNDLFGLQRGYFSVAINYQAELSRNIKLQIIEDKMIINKNLENSKSGSERLINRILKKKQASSTHIIALSLVSIVCFSGCATVGQKIAGAADAVKADVQTQHDENFRLKRVRKALRSGNILEAEEHRDTLYASHWKCIANLEIAAAKYPSDKAEALSMVEIATEEIWEISDANKRAMALLALLKFELEIKKDIPAAKETIKQTEKTIAFILDDHFRKMRRLGELQMLQDKHNHLLSR